MSGRTGADLAALHEVRRVLGRRADDVDDHALAVGRALDWFRSTSTEYVPPLPPHHARGAALAARLDALGHRIDDCRDALLAADRWVGWTAASWVADRQGEHATAVDARAAGAEYWARWRRHGDHPVGDVLAHRTFVRSDVGAHFAGAAWRQQAADSAADLGRLAGRGDGAFTPAGGAGRWARAVDRFGASRAGAVTRLGGRALGVAGVALGAVDAYQGLREGDEERAATGALAAAAGIAVMSGFPPAQLVGSVVTAGLLVHEHRDEIRAGARAAGRRIGAAADAAASFVKGLF